MVTIYFVALPVPQLGCSDSRAVDLVVDEGRSLATQMDALELLLEVRAVGPWLNARPVLVCT